MSQVAARPEKIFYAQSVSNFSSLHYRDATPAHGVSYRWHRPGRGAGHSLLTQFEGIKFTQRPFRSSIPSQGGSCLARIIAAREGQPGGLSSSLSLSTTR